MPITRTSKSLTLKDMTTGSGCTPRTVRYYERQGLLRASRTSGGHRLFAPGELDRLNLIIALREAGWSLEEITQLLNTRAGALTDREARESLDRTIGAQIVQIERKLDLLTRLRADLERSRDAFTVCKACTDITAKVSSCETCPKLPVITELPHCFRTTWRGEEARLAPASSADSLRVRTDREIDVEG